ncbi:MAG: TolB family protein, partial [Haloglomus sp.]
MTGSYPLEALATLPNFYHPFAGGTGDEVAVYYDGTGRNELYVVDAETGGRTQVSDGNVPENAMYPFYVGPAGDRFYFHQDEGGDEQNDIMCLHRDGTVEAVIANDDKCDLTDVSADGRYLLYTSDASGQMNLHRYDRSMGESTQLTAHERPVASGLVSPDGEQIAYTTNEADDPDNQDVYVAAADGSDARNLEISDVGAETDVVDWHPDGTALLVSDNTTDRPRCGVYDLESDTVE